MAKKLTYIKSLDGMRAVFAFAVILTHWSLNLPLSPIGWESMQMFFILSGYLITSVLLSERDKAYEQPDSTFGGFMKGFMIKRTFRIFPVYFGYLLVMYLVRYGLEDSKFFYNQTVELDTNGVWLLTYLYNLKDIFNHLLGWPMVESPAFAHLWSLAMEEQFYVFFPFIIYFVKGRALKITILGMIIAPFFIRLFGYPILESIAIENNYPEQWAILNIYRNLFFQFDSLALGAAAAIFNIHEIRYPKRWFYGLLAVLMVAYIYNGYIFMQVSDPNMALLPSIFTNGDSVNFLGLLYILGHPELLNQHYQYIYMFNLVNLVMFFLIVCAIVGQPIAKWLFENKAIVYLGKISYGTYVYHLALMQFFFYVVKRVAFVPPSGHFYWLQIVYFIIYMSLLYFISHLSYKYFELYFLKLKNKIK